MSLNLTGPKFKLDELEKELESMLDDEREQAQNDVYGRPGSFVCDETPEFLQSSLLRLDEALNEIHEDREAFDAALIVCPEYVNSDEFRLMHLRSTMYDVSLASRKIVDYWTRKVILFGPDKAFRKLSILDFDEEDRVALNRGGLQALPTRDEFGRGILLTIRALHDQRPSHGKSMMRLLWFVLHELLEDPDVQRKGIVCLGVNKVPAHSMGFNGKIMRLLFKDMNNVLPVRIQAIQAVTRGAIIKLVGEMLLYAMGSRIRVRLRFHDLSKYLAANGSKDRYQDLVTELESYGIPSDAIPVDIGGSLAFDYDGWLQRKWLEAVDH